METFTFTDGDQKRVFHVPDELAATIDPEDKLYPTELTPNYKSGIRMAAEQDRRFKEGNATDLGYIATVTATLKWEVVVGDAPNGELAQQHAWFEFMRYVTDVCCGDFEVTIE